MMEKWLKDCLIVYNNLNHLCLNEDVLNNVVLEFFPIFKDMSIHPYVSYQDGISGTTVGIYPDLSIVIEFPYSERKNVKEWIKKSDYNDICFLGEVNLSTYFLDCKIRDLYNILSKNIKFIKYTGEYPSKCKGDLYISINDIEYILSLDDITNGTPYDLYSVSIDKLPKEIQKYYKEIVDIVITNIENTCCGGCLNE